VSDGAIFPHCQNFDDYDRAFDLLSMQSILVQIPFPSEMAETSLEREFNVYKLQLDAPDLKQHLAKTGVHKDIRETELIGSFLDLARKLGRHPPTEDLAPIPVRMGPVVCPSHFAPVVLELAKLGYCLQSDSRMAWLPKVRSIMIAEGIWEGSRLKADVWRKQLYELISMMPEQLRTRATKTNGAVDPLFMHYAFRHHWDPAQGWCEYQRGQPLDSRYHPFSYDQLREIVIAG